MEKELPGVSNIEYDDRECYKLLIVRPESTNIKFKLLIVGHSNVGKSTMINHFCSGVYQDTIPTTGIDFQDIFIRFENETIHLNIGDTGEIENHRSLAHSYYSGVHGVFIVYDITDLNSLLNLDSWINDIENFLDKDAIKILVGNKCDNKMNRKISVVEGQKIAKVYGIPFFEVSSKTNVNMDKLLYTMISACMAKEFYRLIRVEPEAISKKYKLIIVGPSNAGKSSIVHRICNGVHGDITNNTIGIDFKKIAVRFENETISLNIWDTAGLEKYRSLAQSYYKGADGVFFVYDITDLKSLFKLYDWIKDVDTYSDSNSVKILIGSKCDDDSNRVISFKEGQKIAEQLSLPFFEVSSKTNVNMDKLLYTMVLKVHTLRQTTDTNLIKLDKPNIIVGEDYKYNGRKEEKSSCPC